MAAKKSQARKAPTKSKAFIPPFTLTQRQLIEKGKHDSDYLEKLMHRALGLGSARNGNFRHYYLQGPPGIGKTFTVQRVAERNKVPLTIVRGESTIPALVRKLALAAYSHNVLNKRKGYLYVLIDDCDDVLHEGLNIFKVALDQEQEVFSYDVDMSGQVMKYRKSESEEALLLADALEYYQTKGGVGVEVPTSNMVFIIISNQTLATASQVEASKPKSKARLRLMNENALLDRVNYEPLQQNPAEVWGLAAHVVLTTDIFKKYGLTAAQKHDLLEYMYTNWDRLPGKSLRQVEKFVIDMANSPADYRTLWDRKLVL